MPLPLPAKPAATLADLDSVPANKVGEIVDGELFVSPRPAVPHTRAASRLGIDLGGPFDRGRGPIARTLEVYQLQDGRFHVQARLAGDAVISAVPFDAVPLELAALWAR